MSNVFRNFMYSLSKHWIALWSDNKYKYIITSWQDIAASNSHNCSKAFRFCTNRAPFTNLLQRKHLNTLWQNRFKAITTEGSA